MVVVVVVVVVVVEVKFILQKKKFWTHFEMII